MRFSDPRQAAGMSAERQLAYAATWAAEHGLEIDDALSLRDEGLSAFHQKHVRHGALGAFLKLVDDGRVMPGSVLIVEGLDRLSRAEPIQAQAQLAQIINAGITVVTAADGKQYSREQLKANPMDLVYSLLVMIRAHEESDTKSKRVRDAIVRQCKAWMAGTSKARIRNGKDPEWLRYTGTATQSSWEPIPARVEAVQAALDLYRAGHGAGRIIDALRARGLQLTARGPTSLQIYRLVRQEALAGARTFTIGAESFTLPGYYPALLTPIQWGELQAINERRARTKTRIFQVPGIITGIGIGHCGYCGSALVGTNQGTRSRADGTIADGHRRLMCVAYQHHKTCPVPGSCSLVPAERAVMQFCSDQLNLASLFEAPDQGGELRAVAVAARTEVADLERKLSKITDAMLEADGPVAAFTKRAREMEAQLNKVRARYAAADRDLHALARRAPPASQAGEWKAVVEGALALDFDSRMKARRLVVETFDRVVFYRRGIQPRPGAPAALVLISKGGTTRVLQIDAKTGAWAAAEDVTTAPPMP